MRPGHEQLAAAPEPALAELLAALSEPSGIKVRRSSGIIRTEYPYDVPAFNNVFLLRPLRDIAPDFIARAAQPPAFPRRSVFWWVDEADTDGARTLTERGMVEGLRLHRMTASATPQDSATPIHDSALASPRSPGAHTQPVRTAEQFADWLAVWGEARGTGRGVLDHVGRVFSGFGFTADAPVQHFVVAVDGRPKAASTLFCGHRYGAIFNVSTIPDSRRRGLATIASTGAIAEGRRRGYTRFELDVEPRLRGLYERLGFRSLGTARLFLQHPDDTPPHRPERPDQ